MDVVLMIVYAVIVLGLLVFLHEGGHYIAARAFGVRVTEFMLGLPGPSVGFTWKGTRFGVTAVPLGGYARICGMAPGKQSPYLKQVLAYTYKQGTVIMEDVATDLGMSEDEALKALDSLVEWGSIAGPTKKDEYNTYRAPAVAEAYELGQGRLIADEAALYESERSQQYSSLPFWKRSIILLAGIFVNLLFAIIVFVVLYSIIGLDVQNPQTGEIQHMTVGVFKSIQAGFMYIGMVVAAIVGLFNPATAAETVSNSASIIGIAVMSKDAAALGAFKFFEFSAMISVSLGLMNLLPIPPLDGGRFLVEIVQKVSRRIVPERVLGYLTTAGLLLFLGFFIIMINQDIQRLLSGFYTTMGAG